ncbi:hypothetical protein [Halomonas ramblicola]|uniref:hypothetical protein n=1 Tax=Halomonas ramblicola TaxID=747349 RepID=UPI0025B44BF0|nr:hypothetical protein [Halomonas ramblicola]MDN3522549.1 hypothetical protein [Halomonas ramblicola]
MLTRHFYRFLAARLKGPPLEGGGLFVAVGAGRPDWDQRPPVLHRGREALTAELARRAVGDDGIAFLDDDDRPSDRPTARLRVSATFGPGSGEGSLRECGVFGFDAGPAAGSGVLLAYYVHPVVEKRGDATLTRSIRLDLTPRPGGDRVDTRYLGNANSRELHDLENLTGACQVDEISPDRRVPYASREEALAAGYDFCAFCFGRELSRR